MYKDTNDYNCRHNISNNTCLEQEDSNLNKNQEANAQSDSHMKKKRKKKKDKNLAFINDEIKESFRDSKEEWKDNYPFKRSEVSQDHILNQIELINIEDRLRNLEERLHEEINSK